MGVDGDGTGDLWCSLVFEAELGSGKLDSKGGRTPRLDTRFPFSLDKPTTSPGSEPFFVQSTIFYKTPAITASRASMPSGTYYNDNLSCIDMRSDDHIPAKFHHGFSRIVPRP